MDTGGKINTEVDAADSKKATVTRQGRETFTVFIYFVLCAGICRCGCNTVAISVDGAGKERATGYIWRVNNVAGYIATTLRNEHRLGISQEKELLHFIKMLKLGLIHDGDSE